MAGTYNLLKDFAESAGAISVSPHWCLAVIRFQEPVTYDRLLGKSKTDSHSEAIAEQPPLIIASDCVDLQVTSGKEAHVMSLAATLLPGKDYINQILPGDWLMAWMVNDDESLRQLLNKIQNKEPANQFYDGLKFVGKVYGIRKSSNVDASGMLQTSYSLQGVGFSEFDSLIFYQPQLTRSETEPTWLQRFGLALNSIVTGDDKSVIKSRKLAKDQTTGTIDPNKMIPKLIRVIMGEGPFRKPGTQNSRSLADATGDNTWEKHKETPNAAFLVPITVGQLLGRSTSSSQSGVLSFADLIDLIIGVQNYKETSGASDTFGIFTPDGLSDKFEAFKSTGKDIRGDFTIAIQPFNNVPVWQILGNFLNASVNEMYVVLRTSNEGAVVPNLIVRQLPFSSSVVDFSGQKPAENSANAKIAEIPVTKMLELPRWKADPSIVYQIDIGRSDALRFNFVHLSGIQGMTPFDDVRQYIVNPPIVDQQDIKRSGLRPFIKTTNCIFQDIVEFEKWTSIISDITLGQHLMMTGTFVLQGIQVPICPGDNFQFENVVYHIENVTHSCSISPFGQKQFKTIVQVSHGVADETAMKKGIIPNLRSPNDTQYPGIAKDDPVSVSAQVSSKTNLGNA